MVKEPKLIVKVESNVNAGAGGLGKSLSFPMGRVQSGRLEIKIL